MATKEKSKKATEPEPDEEDGREEGGKTRGGKTKLIIIALAAAFLLVAGGAGAYLYFAHAKHPEKQVAKKKKEDALPVEPDPILVKVDNIVAPLTHKGDVSAYVYLSVNIQVKDEPTAEKIKSNLPRLRDAFARDLYDRSIADPKEPAHADISGIQARLLKDAKRVFGADAVNHVYIAHVQYARA